LKSAVFRNLRVNEFWAVLDWEIAEKGFDKRNDWTNSVGKDSRQKTRILDMVSKSNVRSGYEMRKIRVERSLAS
jgi:hypothetical protein